MEHPALLIIDMQNDFVREGALLRVAQAENVIPKIQDVLGAFPGKEPPGLPYPADPPQQWLRC